MTTFLHDVRHTLRMLATHRGFAAVALLTIALGVGGTAAVFSVVYGVLLRPLPYAEPERIVRMWEEHPGAVSPIGGRYLSGPAYRAWTSAAGTVAAAATSRPQASSPSRAFEAIGAFDRQDYAVSADPAGAGGSQRLRGVAVTPTVFAILRVSPAAGRFFAAADADEGALPVVVLSHGFWRDRFASSAGAIGGTLIIKSIAHRIVGVTPPGFATIAAR
jgi:putative ABC transport system permease protein